MDIAQLNGFTHLAADAGVRSKKKEKVEKKRRDLFQKELKRAGESGLQSPGLTGKEELSQLMDRVFSSGEDLVKEPTMSNLRAYRSSVSLFFKFVVKQSLDFDSIEGRLNPKTFEKKCYSLISVVDKKIDDIARNVLIDQRKQFDILGTVEEINGLIIDLIS